MRQLFLAALGVLAVAGVASAQQPRYPAPPAQYPTFAPGAVAATPVVPVSGATVIKGDGGCTNCGPRVSKGFTMSGGGHGSSCSLGYPCQNGCGSVKSDLAFHFGSCKNFFQPCGPSWCGPFGHHCPVTPFNAPWGQGFGCPRAYDSYANH
jgi:hypothetical protein